MGLKSFLLQEALASTQTIGFQPVVIDIRVTFSVLHQTYFKKRFYFIYAVFQKSTDSLFTDFQDRCKYRGMAELLSVLKHTCTVDRPWQHILDRAIYGTGIFVFTVAALSL